MNEELLIKKAQSGDGNAFEELMQDYFKRIYNIAFRMAGNADDASDMTQEVMLKIYRSLSSFKGNSKFSTWVYRVTANTCLDELKKSNRRSALSLNAERENDDGEYIIEVEDTSPTPDRSAEQRELKNMVAAAISYLTPEHRAAIVLRDIKGFSYDEIAHILNCTVGTVKSRISRARAQLKTILEKDFKFDGTYFNS